MQQVYEYTFSIKLVHYTLYLHCSLIKCLIYVSLKFANAAINPHLLQEVISRFTALIHRITGSEMYLTHIPTCPYLNSRINPSRHQCYHFMRCTAQFIVHIPFDVHVKQIKPLLPYTEIIKRTFHSKMFDNRSVEFTYFLVYMMNKFAIKFPFNDRKSHSSNRKM